jgi:hypothetical protein
MAKCQVILIVTCSLTIKDPVCCNWDRITHLSEIMWVYVYNYAYKTFSNIEEYVKYVLQIFVHILVIIKIYAVISYWKNWLRLYRKKNLLPPFIYMKC